MKNNNENFFIDLDNSFDFHNFSQLDTPLPILDILNERLCRLFRVTLSNHLRMICTLTHETYNQKLSDWVENKKTQNCFFILHFSGACEQCIIKFNSRFAYGLIDYLTGGKGVHDEIEEKKEFTAIEFALLEDIEKMLIRDLNEAWEPIKPNPARHFRTEINSEYLGIAPSKIKCRVVKYKVSATTDLGEFEILYPYSTIFNLRNKLFRG